MNEIIESQEYKNWIKNIKSKIHAARTKVALTVTSQVLEL